MKIRLRWLVPGLLAGALAAAAGAAILSGDGHPGSRLVLSAGSAWLGSPRQGSVTLVDGASESVVDTVPAPGAGQGDRIAIVQAGSSALVVNGSDGTITRIDGGTYETSEPVRFTDGGRLSVLGASGGSSVYALDSARATATAIDPVTLEIRARVPMSARPGEGQAAVDRAGALWALDQAQGGLVRVAGGRSERIEASAAGGRLVTVQGRAVLADVAGRRIGALTRDGVDTWSCLEIGSADRLQLLGSAATPRVYAVVPATGTLVSGTIGRDDCGHATNVGSPGDTFGAPVESGRYVFVPNWTTGRVHVVDTAANRVVARVEVAAPGRPVELVSEDGFLFFNDPDGAAAGVIRFDGEKFTGTGLDKFTMSNSGDPVRVRAGSDDDDPRPGPGESRKDEPQPGSELRKPAAESQRAESRQQPAPLPAPDSGRQPAQPAARSPQENTPAPAPAAQPPPADPVDPGTGQAKTDPDPDEETPAAPVIKSISVNPSRPARGAQVTFTANVDEAAGAAWAWQVAGADGVVLARSTSTAQWAYQVPYDAPGSLTVRLTLTPSRGQPVPAQETFSVGPVNYLPAATCDKTSLSIREPVTCTLAKDGAPPGTTFQYRWTPPTGAVMNGPWEGSSSRPFNELNQIGMWTLVVEATFSGQTLNSDPLRIQVSNKCAFEESVRSLKVRAGRATPFTLKATGCFAGVPRFDVRSQRTDLTVRSTGGVVRTEGTGVVTQEWSVTIPGLADNVEWKKAVVFVLVDTAKGAPSCTIDINS